MQSNNVQAKVTDRRKEIETALTEIVDAIEKYSLVAPFEFVQGRDGELGYHVFPDTEHWLETLFPEVVEARRELEEDGIDSDGPGTLAMASERFGFLRGVLVGMKAMGASREQLMERSRGFSCRLSLRLSG